MGEYGMLTVLVVSVLGVILATLWIIIPTTAARMRSMLTQIQSQLTETNLHLDIIREQQEETIQKMSLIGRMIGQQEPDSNRH